MPLIPPKDDTYSGFAEDGGMFYAPPKLEPEVSEDAAARHKAKRDWDSAAAGCVGVLRGLLLHGYVPDHQLLLVRETLAQYDAAFAERLTPTAGTRQQSSQATTPNT